MYAINDNAAAGGPGSMLFCAERHGVTFPEMAGGGGDGLKCGPDKLAVQFEVPVSAAHTKDRGPGTKDIEAAKKRISICYDTTHVLVRANEAAPIAVKT